MRKSIYCSRDSLPLAFGAEEVAEILGVSRATAYVLMHRPEFPAFSVGKRLIISKEKFFAWLDGSSEKRAG